MAGICRLKTAANPLFRWFGQAQSRCFGALTVEIEYDYYEEDEYETNRDRYRRSPMTFSGRKMEGRGVQWVFIGNPSAKKHVYAEKLSKLLQVPHISMGSLVRQDLNPYSSLYKQIANALDQGKLVPEDIIFGLFLKRLNEGYNKSETGFILDGIPRTRIQAEILDEIADIDLVVNFKCTECLLNNRMESNICSHCPGSTNLNSHLQNGQLKSSSISTQEALKEKLRIYAEQSKPLEDYYRKQNKLLNFQVASGTWETWQGLLTALDLSIT